MNEYIYIYIYISIHMCIYIYTHTYVEILLCSYKGKPNGKELGQWNRTGLGS